jgi:hypothetical protein
MRFRLAAAVLAACLLAGSQTRGLTVEKLVAFIESSQKLIAEGKMSDRDVARFLAKTTLSERLEAGTIEDIQGLGAGPQTMEALNRLREQTRGLPVAAPLAPKVAPRPIPPPSSQEQARAVAGMREWALNYTRSLPDFICTQVTRRYQAGKPGTQYGGRAGSAPSWQKLDELTIRLSYFDQRENYKLILINNTPSTQDYEKLGGSTSAGDFGSILKDVFEPATQTRFEWDHWGTLRGQRVMAFAYKVAQDRSQYHIAIKDTGQNIVVGYHGLVEVDKDTHAILRLTLIADGIPADFPMHAAQEILDYDYTDISGRTFLLPLKAELTSDGGSFLVRNIIEFHMYRKYSAESEIKYDADVTEQAPIPEDKTRETADPAPAKPR